MKVLLVFLLFAQSTITTAAEPVAPKRRAPKVKIVYKKFTHLDFDALEIEGDLKNPAEFYFKLREQEKFDSLLKRRPNFHRELLRDSLLMK